jgi:hypothetical protein
MATVKKGLLVSAPEWWRHLRRMKRAFWKRERGAAKREIRKQTTRADA